MATITHEETKQDNPASAVHPMNVDNSQGNTSLKTISYSPLNVKQQFLFTKGLRSGMCDSNGEIISSKVFVRHWRPVLWFLFVVITSFIDLRLNTSWVYSLVIFLIHVTFMLCALYFQKYPRIGTQYTTKAHDSSRFRIYHIADKANRWYWQKSKEKQGIIYPTALCWMFGVVNNWHLLDCSWVRLVPVFGAYISFGQMIINAYWGDTPSMLGCLNFTEEQIKSGHCFIVHQWGLLITSLTCVGLALTCLIHFDISQFTIDTVRAAQGQAEKIVNKLPQNEPNQSSDSFDPYYQCLKNARTVPSQFNSKKVTIFAWFLIILSSFHLLFWEFGTNSFGVIVPITDITTKAVVIVFYLFMIPMFMLVFYAIFVTLKSIYMPYRDLEIIMKVFSYPLAMESLDELVVWWHLRCFYMYYVMPIYYRYGNALFFAYIASVIMIWTIIIYWSFVEGISLYSIDALTGIALFLGIILTVVTVTIATVLANVYPTQQSHLEMLKKEFLKISSDKESGGVTDESTQFCETILTLIADHDVHPEVMGVTVSVYKIYIFVAYAISSFATLILNNKDIFLKK